MKYHLLPALLWLVVGNFLGGNPFVGEWRSTNIKDPEGNGPKVGWEIQFTEDMQYHKLSDEGFNIQMESSGRYSFDEECLQLYRGASDRSKELDYSFKDNLLIIQWGWKDKVEVTLERSKEPLAALHELPTVPRSLNEAADLLVSEMSEEDKEYVRNLSEDQLIQFHMGFGTGIRNRFELWRGNFELLEDCGSKEMHPDDASGVIIHAVWEKLQEGRKDYAEFMQLKALYNEIEIPTVPIRNMTITQFLNALNESIDCELIAQDRDPEDLDVVVEYHPEIPKRYFRKLTLNSLPILKQWGENQIEKVKLKECFRGFSVSLKTPNRIELVPMYTGWFTRKDEEVHYRSVDYNSDSFDMMTEVSSEAGTLNAGFPGLYRSSLWTMIGTDGRLAVEKITGIFTQNSGYKEEEPIMGINRRSIEMDGNQRHDYRVSSYVKPINDFEPKGYREIGELYLKDGRQFRAETADHDFSSDPDWADQNKPPPLSSEEALNRMVQFLSENFGAPMITF